MGLIPESWRSSGVGNEKWKPMPVFLTGKFHRGVWQAIVHGAAKSQTWLSVCVHAHTHTHTHTHIYTFSHSLLKPKEGRWRIPWVIQIWERNVLPKKFQKWSQSWLIGIAHAICYLSHQGSPKHILLKENPAPTQRSGPGQKVHVCFWGRGSVFELTCVWSQEKIASG